jgi:sporulation protein YlmC with PRC-barrel domain
MGRLLNVIFLSATLANGAAAAQASFIDQQGPSQILASRYMTLTVYDSDGMRIGAVSDLVLDPSNGAVVALVIGVGGFLGIAGKNVAVPLSAVKLSVRDGKSLLTVDANKKQFDEAPPYAPLGSIPETADEVSAKPGAQSNKALVPGANSFTEEQARARIEERGLSDVRDLRKDENSIWRGAATRNGVRVSVALDYQGNVVAQ